MKKAYIKSQVHLINMDYETSILSGSDLSVNPRGEEVTPLSKDYDGDFTSNPWKDAE